MKTKAVRIYGKNDLRLEEFELPSIKDDEILARVISDSVCMSSHKAAIQGPDHKRVPEDRAQNPTIIGHEFCGDIIEVGKKWQNKFKPGQRYTVQPAMNYKGSLYAPGYSYKYIGGNATYIVIPNEVMECDCLLPYDGDAYFMCSLGEPMSCIIGSYHAVYHTKNGVYTHDMGIVKGGKCAILAGAGPMGMGCIDYALHGGIQPSLLVVTDIDDARLARAAVLHTVEEAKRCGVELHYVNTAKLDDADAELMNLSGGTGFNDVFVYAPVRPVVEMGDRILARDGCLSFFAGPSNADFKAEFNFYNVHYISTHIVGTSGGNTNDLIESIEMMSDGRLNPAAMITHIGGIDSVIDTILNLPKIPGGKKLIYNHIDLPLTAIEDFETAGKTNPLFAELHEICKARKDLWCKEAEDKLLDHFGISH